jgi:adenylate kinase family enzyme
MTRVFQRLLVIGTAGSGKTSLARALSDLSGLPHIELDLLRYEGDWREVPIAEFRERVTAIAQTDSWIIDGNYAAVRELTWTRAQLVVWIDYSLPVVLRRLVVRTVRRLATAANIGNGNRERFGRLFGRQSIFLWAIRSHSPLRKEYEMAIAARRSNPPHIVRYRSPKETRIWLAQLRDAAPKMSDGVRKDPTGLIWSAEDP